MQQHHHQQSRPSPLSFHDGGSSTYGSQQQQQPQGTFMQMQYAQSAGTSPTMPAPYSSSFSPMSNPAGGLSPLATATNAAQLLMLSQLVQQQQQSAAFLPSAGMLPSMAPFASQDGSQQAPLVDLAAASSYVMSQQEQFERMTQIYYQAMVESAQANYLAAAAAAAGSSAFLPPQQHRPHSVSPLQLLAAGGADTSMDAAMLQMAADTLGSPLQYYPTPATTTQQQQQQRARSPYEQQQLSFEAVLAQSRPSHLPGFPPATAGDAARQHPMMMHHQHSSSPAAEAPIVASADTLQELTERHLSIHGEPLQQQFTESASEQYEHQQHQHQQQQQLEQFQHHLQMMASLPQVRVGGLPEPHHASAPSMPPMSYAAALGDSRGTSSPPAPQAATAAAPPVVGRTPKQQSRTSMQQQDATPATAARRDRGTPTAAAHPATEPKPSARGSPVAAATPVGASTRKQHQGATAQQQHSAERRNVATVLEFDEAAKGPSAGPFDVMVQLNRGQMIAATLTLPKINKGDYVIIDGDRGFDMGRIILMTKRSEASSPVRIGHDHRGSTGPQQRQPPRVQRLATADEIGEVDQLVQDAQKAVPECQAAVDRLRLQLKIVDAQYQHDRKKLTFFFECDQDRVDFRSLLPEMYTAFRCRIWMAKAEELAPVVASPAAGAIDSAVLSAAPLSWAEEIKATA